MPPAADAATSSRATTVPQSDALAAPQSQPSLWVTMVSSAVGGMLARIPCHPLDTVKARLQVDTRTGAARTYRNFADALVKVARSEGLRGLYRGFPVTFIGSAPGTMLYLTSYEVARDTIVPALPASLGGGLDAAGHFCAGMAAEAVSCLFWVPIDVIKERMQVQASAPVAGAPPSPAAGLYYRDTRHAVRLILAGEGLRGLYRGYYATLASFGPFSALYFSFYEQIKALAVKRSDGAPLSFGTSVVVASCAGSLASLVTSPLDLAKLRLQVQRGAAAAAATNGGGGGGGLPAFRYTGVLDALATMAREEGLRSWFRGAGARIAFHAPSTALTMALFEACKGWMEGSGRAREQQ